MTVPASSRSAETVLLRLVQDTAGATGAAFFAAFVCTVADVLLVSHVVLSTAVQGEGRLLVLAASSSAVTAGDVLDASDAPCGEVMASGHALHIPTGTGQRFPACLPAVDSYLGIPLHGVSGELIGVLSIHDETPVLLEPALSVLSSFAARIAGEIQRAKEDERNRERTDAFLRHQTALLGLAQLRVSDVDSAIREILWRDANTLRVPRVSFWSLDGAGTSITCEALFILGEGAFHRGARLDASTYPRYFDALRTRESIVANEARSDLRTSEFNVGYFDVYDIYAMLDVPVWREGRLAGVLCHEQVGATRRWTVEEEEFARAVAHTISLTLEAGARSRAEERYRLVARATGDVLYEWHVASDLITWGDAIATAFGYPRGTIDGTTAEWWFAHIHAADRNRIETSIQQAILSNDHAWTEEYRFHRADGAVAFIVDRGLFIRDGDGVALRVVGSMQDVTARKALEARLVTADRMASMGTLAAGVAHEINNPLAYVMANISFALDELRDAAGDGGVIEALDEALHGATRVMHIVADLKTLSRPDDAPSQAIDVEVVLESSINMAWNEIRHRARLKRSFAHPPPIVATEAQLGQILLNLLINAAQSIPAGSVERHEIEVSTGLDTDDRVFVEVRDTGAGIPPEVLDRIFDPFFTTKAVGEGTGLGLSICHSVVTALGGEIFVSSKVSEGSTFRVSFARAAAAPVRATSARVAAPDAPRRRVLVIDDDAYVASSIRRSLIRNYDVDIETRGREAIARVESSASYDVIICDLMMPDTTGMQVYEELCTRAPEMAARMVFLTGGAFTSLAASFLETVTQPVLHKPFTREALINVITSMVDNRTPS